MRSVASILAMTMLALALAQPVAVTSPPDRFVAPGEYVTLVFRLQAPERLDVDLVADVDEGWIVVRQPGRITLEGGSSTPVAITVEVPRDAPARLASEVVLRVEAPASRSTSVVTLSVTERTSLLLEAPREVTLGPDGLLVSVINDGNGAEEVSVELRRGGEVRGRRHVALGVGEREAVRFDLVDDGPHDLVASSAQGPVVRRTVHVVRFGVGSPPPFSLAAHVSTRVTVGGAPHATFALRGAVSDFTTLDARVDASEWRHAFADLQGERVSVRLGRAARDPLRLGLPADFGGAGTLRGEGWSVGVALGWVEEDRFSGVLSGGVVGERFTAAGAIGLRAGQPLAALRGTFTESGVLMTADVSYRRQALAMALDLEVRADPEVTNVKLDAQGLLSEHARVGFGVRHRSGFDSIYADATAPLGPSAAWNARVGFTERLVSSLPGDLGLGVQVGLRDSFARLTHGTALGDGWRTANAVGVRYDDAGFALAWDTSWSLVGRERLTAEAGLVYVLASEELRGRASIRYHVTEAALSVALGSGWDAADETLGANVVVGWREEAWRAELSTSLGYTYAGLSSRPWRADVRLSGTYAFEIAVPPAIVALTGGRRVGHLVGSVSADGEPLPGVILSVGRYRVETDLGGRYALDLPPGRYDVAVDLATLPIAFRLLDEARTSVDVRLRETSALDVRAARTTLLTGRVLEDRDGDGVADVPERGVAGRLLLTGDDGARRIVPVDEDGRFVVRGLLPGGVTMRLLDGPAGSTVVGEPERRLTLTTGEPVEMVVLVQPAVRSVRSFAASALRVRGVEAEAGRLPPGSAPIVRVRIEGAADTVEVVTPAAAHPLVFRDGAWLGRIAIPADAALGVYAFTVVARRGDAEVTRRAQVVIDEHAVAMEATSDAPVRPGETLRIEVTTYFAAAAVTAAHPFGDDTGLFEGDPGRWSAEIVVPHDAVDAVQSLRVTAVDGGGAAFIEERTFRVFAR